MLLSVTVGDYFLGLFVLLKQTGFKSLFDHVAQVMMTARIKVHGFTVLVLDDIYKIRFLIQYVLLVIHSAIFRASVSMNESAAPKVAAIVINNKI